MSTLILQILQINAKSIPDVKVILNIFLYDLLIVFVILAKHIAKDKLPYNQYPSTITATM